MVRHSPQAPAPGGDLPDAALQQQALSLVDTWAHRLARHRGLRSDEIDDFCSDARVKLLENDAHVLRACRGPGSLPSYLKVVVTRWLHDHCNRLWGRWRPSRQAEKLGPNAVRLEQLLHRDGLSFDEAFAALSREQPGQRRDEVEALANRLPSRPPVRRLVSLDTGALGATLAGDDEQMSNLVAGAASDPAAAAVVSHDGDRLRATLRGALAGLAPQDRLILRLHFEDGRSLKAIEQVLHLQEDIYRRFKGLLGRLRTAFEEAGFSWSAVEGLAESSQLSFSLADETAPAAPGEEK